MRRLRLASVVLVTALAALAARPAQAQYFYPYGYGGYGWGGWSAAAGYGLQARGLGWLAAGEGAYNLQTAEARAINVNTNMQLNEYMYDSILQRDRRLYEIKARENKDYIDAADQLQDRIRNSPTPDDINSGDALNLALDELLDPRYASSVAQAAESVPIDATLIRNIPFENAVDAVAYCLDEITSEDPPEALSGSAFADDVAAYRAITAEINKEVAQTRKVNPETVRKFRDVLKRIDDKVETTNDLDAAKRADANRHLRALMGLASMLDGPSLDVYLAGLGDVKSVTLSKLLAFMQAFNLRFGVAQDPTQRQVYATLYPLLVQVRQQVFKEGTGTLPLGAPPLPNRTARPRAFFNGMSTKELAAAGDRARASGKGE
jgi:hypothetical protein